LRLPNPHRLKSYVNLTCLNNMTKILYSIVEGHGEISAIPAISRRILHDIYGDYDWEFESGHRIPKSRILSASHNDLERAAEFGARRIRENPDRGKLIVVFDADDDCPVTLASRVYNRICTLGVPVSVIVAEREFEAWFLESPETIRHHPNIRDDALRPENPELIRDAKGYFERHVLIEECKYSETIDQIKYSHALDIVNTRSSKSFDKLVRELRYP
jgi:hypothetical protein